MHCLQADVESVLGGRWRWYSKPLGFWQWMGNLRSGDFPKLVQCSVWGQRSRRFPPDPLPCLGDLPAEALSHAHPFSMLMPPTMGMFGLPFPPCIHTQSWYCCCWALSAPWPSTGDLLKVSLQPASFLGAPTCENGFSVPWFV